MRWFITFMWCVFALGGKVWWTTAMKMNRGGAVVPDTELTHLRNQLLSEFISQVKESIAVGRQCAEHLRIPEGQELVEAGQDLLLLANSREKDFSSIFGETPDIVDRIVNGIELKVLVCNAESTRLMVNELMKIYSTFLLRNDTLNISSAFRKAHQIAANLSASLQVDASREVFQSIVEDMRVTATIADRYSLVTRSLVDGSASLGNRPASRYYNLFVSQIFSDLLLHVVSTLYDFSVLLHVVYVKDTSAYSSISSSATSTATTASNSAATSPPKKEAVFHMHPLTSEEQRNLETLLHRDRETLRSGNFIMMTVTAYRGKFRIKKSSVFMFYAQTVYNYVLKIDHDICADLKVASDSNSNNNSGGSGRSGYSNSGTTKGDEEVDADYSCQMYLEETGSVDVFLFTIAPAGLSEKPAAPRLMAARPDSADAYEIKLKKFPLPI